MTSRRSKTTGEQGTSGYGVVGISDQHEEETDAAIFSYKIPRVTAIQSLQPIKSQKSMDYGSFFRNSPPYVSQGKGPPRPYFGGDREWNDEALAEPSVKSSESLVAGSLEHESQPWWKRVPPWAWVLAVIGTVIVLGGIAAIIWAAATGAWGKPNGSDITPF